MTSDLETVYMKPRISLHIMICMLIISSATVYAKSTTWLSEPIVIDSEPEDWYNYSRTRFEDLGLTYSLVNDGEFLYVMLQKEGGMMPGANRVRFWINADNEKKKTFGFILQGPDAMPRNVQSNPDMQRRVESMPRQEMQLDEGLYFVSHETSYPERLIPDNQSSIQMRYRQLNTGICMYEMRIPLIGNGELGVPALELENGVTFRVGFECLPKMNSPRGMESGSRGGGSGGGRGGGGGKGGGGGRGGERGAMSGPPAEMERGEFQLDPKTEWVKFKLADQE
jgi:uncharacterized membrane protein YgcG